MTSDFITPGGPEAMENGQESGAQPRDAHAINQAHVHEFRESAKLSFE